MTENTAGKGASIRVDLIRVAALALIIVLIWCMFYNRWSAASWQIPISYTADMSKRGLDLDLELAKGDVFQQFAMIKAARDGHMPSVFANIVPELGAPYGANWNDYPSTEKAIYWMMGFVAKFIGVFAAANFAALLEDVLAAMAFYAACRLLKYGWMWSFAGAIVFAFARFGFAHEIHHIPSAYVWHVPLCFLVFHWIVSAEGIHFRTRRFIFAMVVAIFTGIQNPYNTNMFAQLVLIGGLAFWWRTRDWRKWRVSLPAATVLGTAAAAFLFVNSNTFLYHIMHGGNPGAVVRGYHWLESYGLKLVDMVMPPPDHRFPPFADWARAHDIVGVEILLQPGEMPPTAYLGLISLASLAWLAMASLRRAVQGERIPIETWLVLWIYLYSDIGGINGVIGTLGFQLFRATTRFSLWILCIVLMYGVRRLSEIDLKKWAVDTFGETPWADWFPGGLALVAVVIALLDQTPPVTTPEELQQTAANIASDRQFTEAMEQSLPPNAMVFQLPIVEYPENPTTIPSYDHFRPYIYSSHLRYSFGSDKGRVREKWQQQIARAPSLNDFIGGLERYGFAGLYVNRNAFQDHGEGFLKALQKIGYNHVVESEKGDLFCVVLKPSPNPILPDADPQMRVNSFGME